MKYKYCRNYKNQEIEKDFARKKIQGGLKKVQNVEYAEIEKIRKVHTCGKNQGKQLLDLPTLNE